MGNWRNRPPRRLYRQQNPWRSPPTSYDRELSSGPLQDNVPSWEKKFCFLVGSVPWRKVVDAQKFMYCHSNILNWDDSAVEETFQNAKKRFWAEMNGFHYDTSMPDPDIYIDEVDWNPVIDPQLIKELDREYFAPDDGEESGKLGRKNKKSRNTASAPSDDTNIVDDENPWECNNNVQVTGILDSKENGWNQWNNHASVSKNVENNDSSWEHSATTGDRNAKDGEWGNHGNNSWGRSLIESHDNQSRGWDKSDYDNRNWDTNENPWNRGYGNQGFVSRKDNGWGSSWDWKLQESNNTANVDDPWMCGSSQHYRAPIDRGWRDNGGDARFGKQWEHYDNPNKDFGFRRFSNRQEAWNEDFQKRGGSSHHNLSGYRNSRFQGDENQTSNYWRRGSNKKRVSFA